MITRLGLAMLAALALLLPAAVPAQAQPAAPSMRIIKGITQQLSPHVYAIPANLRGGVPNVVIGTLLIGTMLNGMTILDVSYSAQNLVKGVILLIAILTDSFLNPRNEETAQQGDI